MGSGSILLSPPVFIGDPLFTRHRAIDRLRKQNSTCKFLERWEKHIYENISSTIIPLDAAQFQERKQQLQQALSQIPIEQQQILMLNYFEGLSRTQIAKKKN